MKKLLSCLLLLLVLLMLPGLAVEADAAEVVDSGTCGENLTWTLDSEGTLTISGTGDMDACCYPYAPWHESRKSIQSLVVNAGVTSIGESAFFECVNLESVILPESLTSLGAYSFSGCKKLNNVIIPKCVTDIGWGAFTSCTSLKNITLSEGLINIDSSAFVNCRNLTNVTLPTGLVSIGDRAFSECKSLTSITIPEGVSSIGDDTFRNCRNLTSITIPDSVTSIGDWAFGECENLTDITIPKSVTSIGKNAFIRSGLTSITLPEDLISIDEHTFCGCDNLSSITIPKSVTSIGEYAFLDCDNLTSVTILDNVTSIGKFAFSQCYKLTSITIPKSVTFIDEMAFHISYALADVYYGGSKEQWDAITISQGNHCLTDANIHYSITPLTSEKPFVDIPIDAYYRDSVLWATDSGITNGTTDIFFSPDAVCTRGQIATFIWRANGSPEPTSGSNPFQDVSSDDYYYTAVLWAVEKGITSGMGDGSFAPNSPCTRGQVATFLWRAEGQPGASAANGFYDVAAGAYYYDAVLWAVENGITNGMGDGTFAPDAPCTRGQIVTFLYRAMA